MNKCSDDFEKMEELTKDMPEPSPVFSELLAIHKPNKEEKMLYELYGDHPLAEDSIMMNVPFCENMVQFDSRGVTDFGKFCTFQVTSSFYRQNLKTCYLGIQYTDVPADMYRFKDVSQLIAQVTYYYNDERIQCYTGNFLRLYNQLQGRDIAIPDKPHVMPNEYDIWIEIPITFHQTNAFPLFYLSDGKFEIQVEFAETNNDVGSYQSMINAQVYAEYSSPSPHLIEPSTIPRSQSVQFLYEKVQFSGAEYLYLAREGGSACYNIMLHFKGPIKTIFWNLYYHHKDSRNMKVYSDKHLLNNAKLVKNGHDLTPIRLPGSFFNQVMSRRFSNNVVDIDKNLYVYTFAEKPSWIRPTGTLNVAENDSLILRMSLIDDQSIPDDYELVCEVYAVSYDIMEINSEKGVGFMFQR